MILKDNFFDYWVKVVKIDSEAKPYWDNLGNERIGHACECIDSDGEEFCDILEELLLKCDQRATIEV